MPIGTIVNALAVIAGSLIGLFLHNRFPENIRRISFQGIGLCTLLIGIQMALKVDNILILIFSILTGSITGEALQLHKNFERFGDFIKRKLKSKNEKFTEGLITAFILFCVGSLTILGALEEGLRNDPTLLYTKSMLDGFASIILSSVYGLGVLLSAVPLFIFQVFITLSATLLQPYLSDPVINQISATGGVLILGLGINLLEIKDIKITNMLPALVYVVILTILFGKYFAG